MTILYVYSDIVGSKDFSVHFLLCSFDLDREFSFSFAFFRSLTENFLLLFLTFDLRSGTFFFLLLLKHICNLIVNKSSFLGDPSIPSSEGKGKNSYPRSRFMADELRFWLKRLVEGRT